jgi:hypothetical protein
MSRTGTVVQVEIRIAIAITLEPASDGWGRDSMPIPIAILIWMHRFLGP